jgi:MarR family transcriptional regulator, organic hydroperoxide resistance regulator
MRESASVKKTRVRGGSNGQEPFPPLSTSLEPFVKDGTDRQFRKLIYSLLGLIDLMKRNSKHFAEYLGVTDAQLMMMLRIADYPDMTVSRLAEQLSVSSPFVTAEITKLAKKLIVEKRPNEVDGRSMLLALTPKGQVLMRELGPLRLRTNDIMFKSLTEERARELQDIVSVLIIDARNALHELEAPYMRGKRAPSAQWDLAEKAVLNRNGRTRAKSGSAGG